ncbi:MAG: nucleotide exchange factor GrpE [Clostridia bacterium]|jgi:molecular chaperone GrpE|nr:nucleotide exchange factor GrpE [Clostridia bacterium]MBT7122125.1 nucleotide exchange factor GrpE [Clostridia bacterium]
MQDDKTKQQDSAKNEDNSESEIEVDVSQDTKEQIKTKPVKLEDKKIAKLTKALKKAEEENCALEEAKCAFKDSYQRTFSEFNNFKKRNQSAIGCAIKDGACDTVAKMLPVLDNFERALEHAEEQEDSAFADGVSMVYKQLVDILTGMDVAEIPSLGEPFDPNVHHAIQQIEVEEDDVQPNTVVMVVQKGYMLGEKILRHSMVIVSK